MSRRSEVLEFLRALTGLPGGPRCQIVGARLTSPQTSPTDIALASGLVAARLRCATGDLEAALMEPRTDVVGGTEMLAEDAIAVRLLASTGATGRHLAEQLLALAAARYEADGLAGNPSPVLYDPTFGGGCRLASLLATAAYEDLVTPYAACTGADVAALASGVLDAVQAAHWGRHTSLAPDGTSLVDHDRNVIATLTRPVTERILTNVRSVLGHHVVRYLAGEGVAQLRRGRPGNVEIPGGFRMLAQRLGRTGAGSAEKVRNAVIALQRIVLRVAGRSVGGLLTWVEEDESPGNPARLHITLGDPLLPGFVHVLRRDGAASARFDRQFVPLPACLPPLVGRGNEQGAQCVFQLLVLQEIRRQARQYAEDGVAHLPGPTLRHLAEQAYLPRPMITTVLDVWGSGTDRAPPFLIGLGNDHFDLAPAYGGPRRLLVAAGRQAENAAQAGRRAAASRARRRSTSRQGRR